MAKKKQRPRDWLYCPRCGGDVPKVREIHSVDANTFVHWCHSVKAHDPEVEAFCAECGWTGTRQDLVKQGGQP